jgi:hypothetical protein
MGVELMYGHKLFSLCYIIVCVVCVCVCVSQMILREESVISILKQDSCYGADIGAN